MTDFSIYLHGKKNAFLIIPCYWGPGGRNLSKTFLEKEKSSGILHLWFIFSQKVFYPVKKLTLFVPFLNVLSADALKLERFVALERTLQVVTSSTSSIEFQLFTFNSKSEPK